MGRLAPILRMVAQRSAGHGRLFAAMTVGAVLAAGLMACVIIYSDAIRDLGLKYALNQQPDRATDMAVMSSSQEFTGKAYETRKATTDALIAQQGHIVTDVVHYARSATFYLTGPSAPLTEDENRPRAHFQSIDELMEHVHLVAGREPAQATLPPSGPPTIEVLAGKAAADQLGFGVGAEFDLHPHWQENAAPVRVVVAGLIEPNDADEAYWFGKTDRFAVTTTAWPTYPFFSDEQTLTTVLGGYLPDLDGAFETYAFVDRGKIDSGNARRVEDGVRGLDSAVRTQLQYSYLQTTLADTIANYREQLFFTRLPLFALMLQVVGIALFYLVMVSTAVVDRQAGEIALMKSRGASTAQVVAVFVLEGLGITVIGTVLGPLLAMASISLLGLTPPFHELSNGDLLDVSVGPWAFAMAALGSVMAFGALLWPAYRASRHSVTHYKAHVSRPDQQSAFLKYYLDLVLIGVAAFLFYQLRQRGSLTTENVFGDLSADPLLLATPSLFMLMVALVFLRIFPLVLKVALWLSRGLKGPTVSLGLTRMARAPVQHSRLILLLILTTAVGMFAAGFRSTLERGYEDRASYLAGADVRLEDVREPLNQTPAEFERTLAPVINSRTVSPAVRLESSYSPTRLSSVSVELLGIDPGRFGKVLNWRGDFASKSKDDLMKAITYQPQPPAEAPVEVPADAQWIGAWARIDGNPAPYFLGIRLVDEEGGYWEYRLAGTNGPAIGRRGGGVVPTGEWGFYAAALENPSVRPNGTARRPVGAKLDSLFIQIPAPYPPGGEQVTAYLDDVEVTAGDPGDWSNGFPGGRVLEGFDSQGRYDLVRGASLNGSPGAFNQSSGDQ
ncbi:MAG: ABC transporter permease, partial [Hyphomicrobiales bacterium]